MQFKYTILYVTDVKATLAFYEKAFGFRMRMLHAEGDYGELESGETVLAFSALSLMQQLGKNPLPANAAAPSFHIALETDDVAAGLQRALGAGATLNQALREEPWGQTTSCVVDNNGFLVEICSPVKGGG